MLGIAADFRRGPFGLQIPKDLLLWCGKDNLGPTIIKTLFKTRCGFILLPLLQTYLVQGAFALTFWACEALPPPKCNKELLKLGRAPPSQGFLSAFPAHKSSSFADETRCWRLHTHWGQNFANFIRYKSHCTHEERNIICKLTYTLICDFDTHALSLSCTNQMWADLFAWGGVALKFCHEKGIAKEPPRQPC